MKKVILVLALLFGVSIYPPDASATYAPDSGYSAVAVAQVEEEGEHKDVPWIPIVILAFIVPIAVLVVPTFFSVRRMRSAARRSREPARRVSR